MIRKQMTRDRNKTLAAAQKAKEAEIVKWEQERLRKQNARKASANRSTNSNHDNNQDNSDASNASQPPRLNGRGQASHPSQIKS